MDGLRMMDCWVVGLLLAIVGGVGPASALGQRLDFENNSTQKIRVQPSPQAQRIGSAVQWQPDLDSAFAESLATGKPVFWYVPTLRGSFMDRVDSIDRYMRAGPFSWPDIIELLNERFVPVNAPPQRVHQKKFDLKPYVFIEPGFLILDSGGDLVKKVDRLTTLHPVWFRKLLESCLNRPPAPGQRSPELEHLWKQFAAGQYKEMDFPVRESSDERTEERTEDLLLEGMVRFRLGDHSAAKKLWKRAAVVNPESPLAWKAAAEGEGFGPFVRGFEVHRELPRLEFPMAQEAGTDRQGAIGNEVGPAGVGSAAPRGTYDEAQLWQRGTDFILGMQDQSGSWKDSDYDFGGADSLPNVHAAVTAIAGMALLNAMEIPVVKADLARLEALARAVDRTADYLVDDRNMCLSDRDELFWAYAYRVRFMARLAEREPRFIEPLRFSVERLAAIQLETGGWFHEYANPFVTATALIALMKAEGAGARVEANVIERGLGSLGRDRYENGAFPYKSVRDAGRTRKGNDVQVAAAAGRMPLCELALRMGESRMGESKMGKSKMGREANDAAISHAVVRSLELNRYLMSSLKYDGHTSNLQYGGFFFWFDMQGRSDAIARLADGEARHRLMRQQRALILSLPEIDGCFVDSHELGRVYGTAMALLSLPDALALPPQTTPIGDRKKRE